MDKRQELRKNDILDFPGLPCVIDKAVGRGSNVIVYLGHYRDHQNPDLTHRVLIRELFPYDPQSRIVRDENGNIVSAQDARSIYELNRLTFLRGNEIHLRLAADYPEDVDVNMNTYEYRGTMYSLLGFSGGRTLEQELGVTYSFLSKEDTGGYLLRVIRIMKGALEVLSSFHDSGYLHLDISPDNILLIGKGDRERVTLIDHNSVHSMREIQRNLHVYYSIKEGYTAPEVTMGRFRQVCPSTDLYSMTAVLYRCVTGSRLTLLQETGLNQLDIRKTPLMEGCPETVISMLQSILKKGLSISPRRRWLTAREMLVDLTELEDRITGKGITHWALWESGRRRLYQALSDNTALNYILDHERLYPLYAEDAESNRVSLLDNKWLLDIAKNRAKEQVLEKQDPEALQQPASSPVLLLGSGGTGKTTSLLRMAYSQPKRYSPEMPAVFYISLFGYRDGTDHFVRDTLLEGLKFKPHTDSMESARRELMQLLEGPHSVLLLLDGFNEAAGDTSPLLQEIHLLSKLTRVRIVLTSRSDPDSDFFDRHTLCRLDRADVQKILSEKGILPPENIDVFELLCIPLLLSIYIRTVLVGERQIQLQNKEQLLDEYFNALLKKEAVGISRSDTVGAYMQEEREEERDAPQKTADSAVPAGNAGIEAAVRFLLPEIAAVSSKKQSPLTSEELLQYVEKWYRVLSNRALTVVYPQWIGRTEELRLGARNADEWYGKAVLGILWKQLGLLMRDDQGCFRVLHQIIEEYLVTQSEKFHRQFDPEKRRMRDWKTIKILTAALIVLAGFGIFTAYMFFNISDKQKQILRKDSENLADVSQAAMQQGNRYTAINKALEALPSSEQQRPLITSAERALASADLAWTSPAFHQSRVIDLPSEIHHAAISKSGRYLIVLDKNGVMHCLNGKTGEHIWQKTWYYNPSLQIFEDKKTVLVFSWHSVEMLSLENGEIVWEFEGEGAIYDFYNNDDELILVGIEKIFHIDIETGEKKSAIAFNDEDLIASFFLDDKSGLFVDDPESCVYYISLYGSDDSEIQLSCFNLDTGNCDKTISIPVNTNYLFNNDHVLPCNIQYVTWKSGDTEKSGWVGCFILPTDSYKALMVTGIIEEGKDEWIEYDRHEISLHGIDSPSSYPGLSLPCFSKLDDEQILIIYGNEYECLYLAEQALYSFPLPISNHQYDIPFSENHVVYYRCRKDTAGFLIVYKNGTCDMLIDDTIEHMDIYKGEIEAVCGNGFREIHYNYDDMDLSFSTLFKPSNSSKDMKDVFCYIPSDNKCRICVVEWIGDTNGISFDDNDLYTNFIWSDKDQTGRNIYLLPDGKSLLILYNTTRDSFYFKKSETKELKGCIIDLSGMTVKKTFGFDIPRDDTDLMGISCDGNTLYFKNNAYEIKSENILKIDIPTAVRSGVQVYNVNRQHIIENCALNYTVEDKSWVPDEPNGWEGKTIHWFYNGKEYIINLSEKGKDILDHSVMYLKDNGNSGYMEYYSDECIKSGDNGLLLVPCTTRERSNDYIHSSSYNPPYMEYLMVYSLDTEEWTKIELPPETDAEMQPYLSTKEKWLAIPGADNIVRIYAGDVGECIIECEGKVYYKNILKMQFIKDDRYLVVWEINGVSVFDTSDGKCVFYRAVESDFPTDDTLSLLLFEDGNNLYFTGKSGFCLDTENWEIRYNIPFLAYVTDDSIITQEYWIFTRYPKYSLSDLIKMGNEELEQMENSLETIDK